MQRKRRRSGMVSCFFTGVALIISVCSLNPLPAQTPAQGGAAAQQSAAAPPLSFEVASIKPSQGQPGMVMIGRTAGGMYRAQGATLQLLIQQAFDIRDYQITGLPGWASSDRYDIVAKAENPNATSEQTRQMLQSLLVERFNLKFHRETKELPTYSLVVGKNGPKIKKSEYQPGDNPPPNAAKPGDAGDPAAAKLSGAGVAASGGGAGAGGGPVAVKPNVAGGGAAVGHIAGEDMMKAGPPAAAPKGSMMRMGPGSLSAQSAPISLLTRSLAQALGRPVIDNTGLTGAFDYELTYAPESVMRGMGVGGGDSHEVLPAGDSTAPSIFTAVQEQLGLKLESQKGPVEILVIDSVDKPSGN